MLHQLLSQHPSLISQILLKDRRYPASASSEGAQTVDWTQLDLQDTLHACIVAAQDARILILLDGLDELDGTDETREQLLEFLSRVASLDHVKICLSSRPLNIFRDAFRTCPGLRLEDLTRNDINLYVAKQLSSSVNFRRWSQYQSDDADALIREVSAKASGVFLWVRLVIRELLIGLRDGDNLRSLQKRLHSIPEGLNDYFRRMLDSIQPHQRLEASVFLQVALYKENDFISTLPLRLTDLLFTEEDRPDFILPYQNNAEEACLAHYGGLEYRLDSALRRLNSRCMGLLECQHQGHPYSHDNHLSPRASVSTAIDRFTVDTEKAQLGDDLAELTDYSEHRAATLLQADRLVVRFFHRTCYDFLLDPELQDILLNYSEGPYDVQMYLLNSRICEFLALGKSEDRTPHVMQLASNILGCLARPMFRNIRESRELAAIIKTTFEDLVLNHPVCSVGLYLTPSVSSWNEEHSSFLTLAIDFTMVSYVKHYLNPSYILSKRGRPILDYVLRPRFPTEHASKSMTVGNQSPNYELLSLILNCGAQPNEIYGFASVWALFLRFLADFLVDYPHHTQLTDYTIALELMIRAGAATTLPRSWLMIGTDYVSYSLRTSSRGALETNEFSFRRPGSLPYGDKNAGVAVSDILEHFRPSLGSTVDRLKELCYRNINKGGYRNIA